MQNKGRNVEITQADDGIRLDRWFKRHYPDLPHARLENMLRRGQIRLDRSRVRALTRIQAGQILRLAPFTYEEKTAQPLALTRAQKQELLSRVLYDDGELLVFNKPHGLAVQGGSKTRKHLDNMLAALPGENPRLVHRLDKATSGVLLLARSARKAAELTSLFRARRIEKIYWALTYGVPKASRGVITDVIDGRSAKTHYEVYERHASHCAWVIFMPITGRRHQIRLHAARLGTPIIGDRLCPKESRALFPTRKRQLHLHARSLRLPAGRAFTAPLSEPMAQTWQELGFILPKP